MARSKPPDEKSIEVVFAAYAALLAHEMGKKLITFAPSQAQEKWLGYDSKLIGKGCRELYIQFKRVSAHNYGFAFHPSDKAQLDTLKTRYPPLSAFYVAASFSDDNALFNGQHELDPAEFLDRYIAVDVQALEYDSNSVRFSDAVLNRKADCGANPNQGRGWARKPIERPLWLAGSELLCGFLGCEYRFTIKRMAARPARPNRGCRLIVRDEEVYRVALDVADNVLPDVYPSWSVDTVSEPVYMPRNEVNLMLRVFD